MAYKDKTPFENGYNRPLDKGKQPDLLNENTGRKKGVIRSRKATVKLADPASSKKSLSRYFAKD